MIRGFAIRGHRSDRLRETPCEHRETPCLLDGFSARRTGPMLDPTASRRHGPRRLMRELPLRTRVGLPYPRPAVSGGPRGGVRWSAGRTVVAYIARGAWAVLSGRLAEERGVRVAFLRHVLLRLSPAAAGSDGQLRDPWPVTGPACASAARARCRRRPAAHHAVLPVHAAGGFSACASVTGSSRPTRLSPWPYCWRSAGAAYATRSLTT